MVPLFGGPSSVDDPDTGLPSHESELMEVVVKQLEDDDL